MKLNEHEIELLKKVREVLAERYSGIGDSNYICWTIVEVVHGRCMMNSGMSMHEAVKKIEGATGNAASSLLRLIELALNDTGVMDNWMAAKEFEYGQKKNIKFYNPQRTRMFVAEARLCWLDRMIETGVIDR